MVAVFPDLTAYAPKIPVSYESPSGHFSVRENRTVWSSTGNVLYKVLEPEASSTVAETMQNAPGLISKEQAWFWSAEWQAQERLTDEDMARRRYQDFGTMDDFLSDLFGDEG